MSSTNGKGYSQERWSLDELFPALNAPEVNATVSEVQATVQAFEQFRPKLTPDIDAEEFVEILDAQDSLVRQFNRLYGFGSLSFSADTQDQQAQVFLARVQKLGAEAQNRTMFFELWWKELDEESAERLLYYSGDYRYWLEALRLETPYTLTEPEEKIVNFKNITGRSAHNQTYAMLTNRYTFLLEVNGETKELTREELSGYYRDSNPEMRAAAYRELYRVYGADAPILGQIYQTLVRDWRNEFVDMRGHAAPIAVRNLANDIPNDVVDTLIDVVKTNVGVFHRFFALKAQWLGVEKLRRYDVYAPVVATDKRYPFADAVNIVLESFDEFEPRIAQLARRVFDEHHIDSEIRPGKRGGAFCATLAPDLTPWVLQSYEGRPRDVATMAHELGHAIHSMLAEHHSALTQQSSLPLAETASTFGEMLLTDRLLALDADPEVQRDILFTQMDDAYATIMRQIFFAIFEVDAHEAINNGASVDELCELYLDNLREQFGESVDVSDDFKYEWVAIPHIYQVPFYVYAYAFGQLLVLALYKQFLEEGASFKPRYIELLAAGGSASPVAVLTKAGVDIHSADFWQGAFDVLAEYLGRLEEMPLPA